MTGSGWNDHAGERDIQVEEEVLRLLLDGPCTAEMLARVLRLEPDVLQHHVDDPRGMPVLVRMQLGWLLRALADRTPDPAWSITVAGVLHQAAVESFERHAEETLIAAHDRNPADVQGTFAQLALEEFGPEIFERITLPCAEGGSHA